MIIKLAVIIAMNTKRFALQKQRNWYLLALTVAISVSAAAVWSLVTQQNLHPVHHSEMLAVNPHQLYTHVDVYPVAVSQGVHFDVATSQYNVHFGHAAFVHIPRNNTISLDELYQAVGSIPEISSFQIYQDGEVKVERYWRGHQPNRAMNIKSASKTILSTLTGLALQEGFIESLDDPIARYIPDYMRVLQPEAKQRITVRHLLTMSSGLETTSFGNYGRWVVSRDWTRAALRGELQAEPGTRMQYSTGDTHILSAVLTEATGMTTRAYAESRLFQPMGIRVGGWDRSPEGYYFGGNNLALSPAALMAYGRLYLDGGVFNGEQLIPADWVQESMQPVFFGTSFNPRAHNYGYLWWNNTFGNGETAAEVYFAWGFGGQYVFVIPSLHAVVVLTGNPDARGRGANGQIYRTMDTYIVPWVHQQVRSVGE